MKAQNILYLLKRDLWPIFSHFLPNLYIFSLWTRGHTSVTTRNFCWTNKNDNNYYLSIFQARDYMLTKDLNKYIKPTLQWLLDQRLASGNLPSSISSPTDKLVQWCHGAPGFVPLCIKAYQVTIISFTLNQNQDSHHIIGPFV